MINTHTRRPLVLCAIIMAMFMGAIEANIVATSMPTIVAQLGDVSLYSWVFSAFLLMQAVTVPIYGKLSDLFGRKRVFSAGLLIFLLGSVLCGFATSMLMLTVFRAVQGVGAGAVLPLAITLVGDMYAPEERGRIQGYLGSVWGISSVVGPLSGALIVQYTDWAWVFWVNVPFALVALLIIGLYLHEDVDHKNVAVDYAGAALLLVGLSALMLLLTHGGELTGRNAILVLALGLAAGVAFYFQERRALDPIVRGELWRQPLIATANAATLAMGMAMVGVINFLPTFAQGVLGSSPVMAGFALGAMSIGWPIAASTAGRHLPRVGARRLARIGGGLLVSGTLLLALFAERGLAAAAIGSFVMGAGLGTLNTVFIVSIQSSVDWSQRGAATASSMLMRTLGNAIGSALFGGLINHVLQRHLAEQGQSVRLSVDDVQSLLGGPGRNPLDAASLAVLQTGLAASMQWLFWGVLLVSLLTCAIAWRMRDWKATPTSAKA
jgi:EmrB/QacA subfamily drug resistance transporter